MMTTISSIKITSEGYISNEFLTKLPKNPFRPFPNTKF